MMERFRVCKWDNLKVFMIMGIVLEHSLIIYNYPRGLELVWLPARFWLKLYRLTYEYGF
jgi:hypothetical protein